LAFRRRSWSAPPWRSGSPGRVTTSSRLRATYSRRTRNCIGGWPDDEPRVDTMNLDREYRLLLTRRQLFRRAPAGIGTVAVASLLNERLFAAGSGTSSGTHFAPKAKRIIYLFMSGGPSHIDLFDYKPKLKDYHGTELPSSVRMGQRVTGMTAGQKS